MLYAVRLASEFPHHALQHGEAERDFLEEGIVVGNKDEALVLAPQCAQFSVEFNSLFH